MIRTKKFYYLVATMMCGLMPYYLVSPISQTIQIERGILQAVAVGSVMAGSILNAGIRLILPTLADRAGRITLYSRSFVCCNDCYALFNQWK